MGSKKFDLTKYLIQVLRKSFLRTPWYSIAKNKAKEYYKAKGKTKDLIRVGYRCAKCKRFFEGSTAKVAVDHINPVVEPKTGWVDFNTYIDRLYCDYSNLQVLCNYSGLLDGVKSCHSQKSKEENKIRRSK